MQMGHPSWGDTLGTEDGNRLLEHHTPTCCISFVSRQCRTGKSSSHISCKQRGNMTTCYHCMSRGSRVKDHAMVGLTGARVLGHRYSRPVSSSTTLAKGTSRTMSPSGQKGLRHMSMSSWHECNRCWPMWSSTCFTDGERCRVPV